MNKKWTIAIVIIIIAIGALAAARLFRPEDTWICRDGQWVKHGKPSAPQPTQGCGENKTKPTTAQAVAEAVGKKYNKPASEVEIQVITDTGKFAKGSVRFAGEMSGGLWFAANTDKGWELAFDGNGIIPCDAANKYSFPNDMVPQCIETQNNNKLIRR